MKSAEDISKENERMKMQNITLKKKVRDLTVENERLRRKLLTYPPHS